MISMSREVDMILFFLALVHHHKFVFVITFLVSDEQMGSSSAPRLCDDYYE